MQVVEGTVTEIRDHGFVLDTGAGVATEVITQTSGRKLGLRRGDRVRVFGGRSDGVFLSSRASKSILFGRVEIRVPVSAHERRSLLWWL